MRYIDIVKEVNRLLDGERLTEAQLISHFNSTIDDINEALNAIYPTFSEYQQIPGFNAIYDAFPDNYIRTVVCAGAAYKWYLAEEEGEQIAATYGAMYERALFIMKRDWLSQVPEVYRATQGGMLPGSLNFNGQWSLETDPSQGYFGALGWVPMRFQGPEGPRGPRGYTGERGPIGEKGDKGDKGDTGATGPIGLTGPRGFTGETGPQGEIGPIGPKGNTGPRGDTGTNAYQHAVIGGYTRSEPDFNQSLSNIPLFEYMTASEYAAAKLAETLNPYAIYLVTEDL